MAGPRSPAQTAQVHRAGVAFDQRLHTAKGLRRDYVSAHECVRLQTPGCVSGLLRGIVCMYKQAGPTDPPFVFSCRRTGMATARSPPLYKSSTSAAGMR